MNLTWFIRFLCLISIPTWLYSDEYVKYPEELLVSFDSFRGWQYRFTLQYLDQFTFRGDEAFLHIGCLDGQLTTAIQERYHLNDVIGLDTFDTVFPKNNPQFIKGNLCEMGWKNKFDFILSTNVIEWEADYRQTLIAMKEALKPGGIAILLLIPNDDNWLIPLVSYFIDKSGLESYKKYFQFEEALATHGYEYRRAIKGQGLELLNWYIKRTAIFLSTQDPDDFKEDSRYLFRFLWDFPKTEQDHFLEKWIDFLLNSEVAQDSQKHFMVFYHSCGCVFQKPK